MDHELRRKRLLERLADLEADAFLVTRLPNVRYLTGFTGSNGQLLLGHDRTVFLTDTRYEEQAGHEVPGLERVIYSEKLVEALTEVLGGISRLAFERAGVTYATYERLAGLDGVALVPTGEEVERLRWSKDDEELAAIEQAQVLTDDALDAVLPTLAVGVTEREVALRLEVAMREAGAERIGFDVIAAFGENAAEPHHHPTDRALRRGDLVKLDFGCVWNGYCSDMTRTVAFGEPPEELVEIYDIVRNAQGAGREAVRAGVSGREADRAARDVIAAAGFGERFGHSLGHGIGLEVHEGPTLRKTSEDVLPEGAVVTVEPGIYVPGVGGVRIEDMVVVEAGSSRALPRSTRDLIVL